MVGHCITGVDIDPVAVSLCQLALWEIAAPHDPDMQPIPSIRCGNALLGTTSSLMEGGIPNAAFRALPGDDPLTSRTLRSRNGRERRARRDGDVGTADGWCAAFVWPQVPELGADAPTDGVWRAGALSLAAREQVQILTRRFAFFHWHLEFPQIFAKGGFNVVIGNPPWEQLELNPAEFFASHAPEVAAARNQRERAPLVELALARSDDLVGR